jgi:hypothetical protein
MSPPNLCRHPRHVIPHPLTPSRVGLEGFHVMQKSQEVGQRCRSQELECGHCQVQSKTSDSKLEEQGTQWQGNLTTTSPWSHPNIAGPWVDIFVESKPSWPRGFSRDAKVPRGWSKMPFPRVGNIAGPSTSAKNLWKPFGSDRTPTLGNGIFDQPLGTFPCH